MTEWREVEEPKIWASRFPRYLDGVSFDWSNNGGNEEKIQFIHGFRDRLEHIDAKLAPKFLYFGRHKKIPSTLRDAFKIIDGLRVISPALRDVLMAFDMDGVQLFEVPILQSAEGGMTGLPNHFVLNVHGAKDALIPELSENIEKPIMAGETEPIPNANWWPSNDLDVIALRADAGGGADIWRDVNLDRTLFFSDRLKQAIDAAGLKTKALSFAPTRVFEEV